MSGHVILLGYSRHFDMEKQNVDDVVTLAAAAAAVIVIIIDVVDDEDYSIVT